MNPYLPQPCTWLAPYTVFHSCCAVKYLESLLKIVLHHTIPLLHFHAHVLWIILNHSTHKMVHVVKRAPEVMSAVCLCFSPAVWTVRQMSRACLFPLWLILCEGYWVSGTDWNIGLIMRKMLMIVLTHTSLEQSGAAPTAKRQKYEAPLLIETVLKWI